MFSSNSSKVSPCVAQPASDGTSAQYPPSSALWITTFNFIEFNAIPSKLLYYLCEKIPKINSRRKTEYGCLLDRGYRKWHVHRHFQVSVTVCLSILCADEQHSRFQRETSVFVVPSLGLLALWRHNVQAPALKRKNRCSGNGWSSSGSQSDDIPVKGDDSLHVFDEKHNACEFH